MTGQGDAIGVGVGGAAGAGADAGADAGAGAGGALVLSGGGTTMVATDVMFAQAARVRLLQAEAEGWQARLRRIRALDLVPAPAWTGDDPGLALFDAARAIDTVEALSRDLAESLVAAAEGYGRTERGLEQLARLSGAWLGYLFGRVAPLLLVTAMPAVTAGLAAWLIGNLFNRAGAGREPGAGPTGPTGPIGRDGPGGPDTPGGSAGGTGWLLENPRFLTNPQVVALVRVLVSSVDDAAAGAVGVPVAVPLLLGDDGAGLLGVTSSAAGLLAVARPIGLLRESPVSVARAGKPWPVTAPSGLGELAARIPPATEATPQLRIERYGPAGHASWVVYVGGTAQWNPTSADDPWDLTSNVAAIAEQDAGSYRAVVQAMRDAGIQPGDPVIPVGHSQGGVIAAQVAASGQFHTVAVATFGAPTAQVPVPSGVPELVVEHTDDLVTALGGSVAAATAERLIVSREAFAGREVPTGQVLPAHGLSTYRETAQLIDSSPEPRLQEFRAQVAAVVGASPGEAARWRGVRLPASAPE